MNFRSQLKVFAIFALGSFFICAPAQASTDEMMRAVLDALGPFYAQTMLANERRSLAQANLDYWGSFDSRIPRNSPSEQEWLTNELDTRDSQRIVRAMNSPEYARSNLSRLSSLCVALFKELVPIIGNNSRYEMYLWLKTTQCFYNADTATYLRIAGLSNGKLDGSFKMIFFSMVLDTITGKLANTLASE